MRCLAAALLFACAALPAIDDDAVLAAARAVSIEYQSHFQVLSESLRSAAEDERLTAMRELGALCDPEAVPLLLPFLQGEKRSEREQVLACAVLSRLGAQVAIPMIKELTRDHDTEVRKAAVLALQQFGPLTGADWMQHGADADQMLRLTAAVHLGQIKHAEAAPLLVAGLRNDKSLIRQAACIGLGLLGDAAQAEKLRPMLCDADPAVRRYAAEALARLHATQALPDLLLALDGGIAGAHILRAIRLLTGQDFGYDLHGSLVARQQAIDRGFAWISQQPKKP